MGDTVGATESESGRPLTLPTDQPSGPGARLTDEHPVLTTRLVGLGSGGQRRDRSPSYLPGVLVTRCRPRCVQDE
jgi:hypothetical protein